MAEFGEMVIVYNLLPEIAAKLDEAVDEAVRKAAFDIQGIAQAEAGTFRRTGFLTNSIYTRTHEASTYGQVGAPVENGQELLPEVEEPKKHEAVVAVGANYGVFVEFGTVHMGAHPYLTPAAEFVRPKFIYALEKMEEFMAAL